MELWSSTLELQLCHARMCDWHGMGMEGFASQSSCCATCTGGRRILVVVGHTAGACIGRHDHVNQRVAHMCACYELCCGLGPMLRAGTRPAVAEGGPFSGDRASVRVAGDATVRRVGALRIAPAGSCHRVSTRVRDMSEITTRDGISVNIGT